VIPSSWRLLQTVEGLVEPTHQLRVGLAVDHLCECAVEECVLDVELVHEPTPGDDQRQHNMDGDWLDNGAEGLAVVHIRVLGELLENPMSFVLI
jgi:hypothetical protein